MGEWAGFVDRSDRPDSIPIYSFTHAPIHAFNSYAPRFSVKPTSSAPFSSLMIAW
jgi:hypothetical protein